MEIDYTIKLGTLQDLWVAHIAQEIDKAKKAEAAAAAEEAAK